MSEKKNNVKVLKRNLISQSINLDLNYADNYNWIRKSAKKML